MVYTLKLIKFVWFIVKFEITHWKIFNISHRFKLVKTPVFNIFLSVIEY